jgi:hypothetical protein
VRIRHLIMGSAPGTRCETNRPSRIISIGAALVAALMERAML